MYWQNLEENEAKYLLGKVAEAMNYDSIDSQFYRTRDRLYNQLHSAAYTPEDSSETKCQFPQWDIGSERNGRNS